MSEDLTKIFISKYGDLSKDYEYVSPSGSISGEKNLFLYIGIGSLISGIVMIGLSKPTENPKIKKKKRRTTIGYVMLVVGILFLLGSLGGFGYYGYIYIVKYLPEYKMWYDNLPEGALDTLMLINYRD